MRKLGSCPGWSPLHMPQASARRLAGCTSRTASRFRFGAVDPEYHDNGFAVNGRMSRSESGDVRLGMVGAGKLGTTLAHAAISSGYDVAISGSGGAERIALIVDVLAPGVRAVSTEEVVRHSEIIVLAVPMHRFRELPRDRFANKILIDAMNYWEQIDGFDEELATASTGTSVVVQERFPSARVVKSLNQFGYHEFAAGRSPRGLPGRFAVAAAGDDRGAVRAVLRLIDRLGFDAVDAGPLERGLTLEPGGVAFGTTHSAGELSNLLWPYARSA